MAISTPTQHESQAIESTNRAKKVSAAKQIELVSIDDYLAGELESEVRHEYLGGSVYAMAGARNVHNRVAWALYGSLHEQLRGKTCEPFNPDTKVRIRFPTHTRFYYPDVMVVCEPNPAEDTFQDKPVVIAEVISETTRRTDEGEKRDAYLTIPTLTAYLLIETGRPRAVVHRRTDTGIHRRSLRRDRRGDPVGSDRRRTTALRIVRAGGFCPR